MNHIQTPTPEALSDPYRVEFYPSADDYAYISTKISNAVPRPALIQYSYQAFLFINAIGFPIFLWLSDYLFAAVIVAALNTALLYWVLSWMNRAWLRQYYDHVFGERDKKVATVELSSEGIRYEADGGQSFFPWRHIEEIDETDDALFFFFWGSGIAVRKSGFAYREQQIEFLKFAQENLRAAKAAQLQE